jgi:hypothetical protein
MNFPAIQVGPHEYLLLSDVSRFRYEHKEEVTVEQRDGQPVPVKIDRSTLSIHRTDNVAYTFKGARATDLDGQLRSHLEIL